MTDFQSTFVATNLLPGSKPYDANWMNDTLIALSSADPDFFSGFEFIALSVMLLGMRRGDAVPRLFEDATKDLDDESSVTCYMKFREAAIIVYSFIGLPNIVPSMMGIAAYLQGRGISPNPTPSRPVLLGHEESINGKAHFKKVYNAVGNSKVSELVDMYFPDIAYTFNAVTFGYIMSRANNIAGFTEAQGQFIVAAAITAMGATRQARSHIKAALDMGCSLRSMSAMVQVCTVMLAEWSGYENAAKGKLDTSALMDEVAENRTLNAKVSA
ncbi:uncharacterized protein V1518DRAFT_219292 [Limtongia smithiae]|uniref:uncharacterized protein n=1 Tax=Limtongia smithiae TaxID=1125753 RepID=UPI0034CF592B